MIAHLAGQPITIYGDGKEVRDLLFVDDLVDGYVEVIERIDRVSGMTFNIGGGPGNTLSLLELIDLLERLSGRPVATQFAAWHAGDQPAFVSDVRSASVHLGWDLRVGAWEGVQRLYAWVAGHPELFTTLETAT